PPACPPRGATAGPCSRPPGAAEHVARFEYGCGTGGIVTTPAGDRRSWPDFGCCALAHTNRCAGCSVWDGCVRRMRPRLRRAPDSYGSSSDGKYPGDLGTGYATPAEQLLGQPPEVGLV